MRNKTWKIIGLFLLLSGIIACSSSKPVQKQTVQEIINQKINSAEEKKQANLDISHEAFLRALMLEQKGEHSMALEFLAHASKADPKNRYLAFQVAMKVAETGDYKMALAIAENAKKLPGPEKKSQLSLLASMYMQNRMVDSAKVYFKKTIEQDERDYLVLYEYSILLETIKKYDELIRIYDILLPQINYGKSILNKQIDLLTAAGKDSALIDLMEEAYNAHGETDYLRTKADLLIKNKRYDEALELADRFLTVSKKDTTGILIRSRALVLKGQLNEALDYLKIAYFKEKIPSAMMLNFIALIELDLKMVDSAKVHLKMLTENKTFAAPAHADLSSLARADGDTLTAIAEIEKAAALDPENYIANKAYLYYLYGRFDDAYVIYDSLLGYWSSWQPTPELLKKVKTSAVVAKMKINANKKHQLVQTMYANALLYEAYLLEKGKKDSLTIQKARNSRTQAGLFLESLIIADSNNVTALFDLAANYERVGMYEKSIEAFNSLLKKDPKNHQALNYLGYTLVDLNRSVKEVELGASLIDSALKYLPKDPAYLDSKAWALYRQGNFKEAFRIMELILSIESKDFDDLVFWEHFAAIAKKLGLEQKALDAYNKILQIDPNHVEAQKNTKPNQ